MYLDSTKVKVFPSAYRGKNALNKQYNPEARLNSEVNFANMITGIVGRKSYVISYIRNGTNGTLICCLAGYWFELKVNEEDFKTGENYWSEVYASIKISNLNPSASTDTGNTEFPATSLVVVDESAVAGSALDNNSHKFIGISLTDTAQTSGYTESFHILSKQSSTSNFYVIPTASSLRISTDIIENSSTGVSITDIHGLENFLIVGDGASLIQSVQYDSAELSGGIIYLNKANGTARLEYIDSTNNKSFKLQTGISSSATSLDFDLPDEHKLSDIKLDNDTTNHKLTITIY